MRREGPPFCGLRREDPIVGFVGKIHLSVGFVENRREGPFAVGFVGFAGKIGPIVGFAGEVHLFVGFVESRKFQWTILQWDP